MNKYVVASLSKKPSISFGIDIIQRQRQRQRKRRREMEVKVAV